MEKYFIRLIYTGMVDKMLNIFIVPAQLKLMVVRNGMKKLQKKENSYLYKECIILPKKIIYLVMQLLTEI